MKTTSHLLALACVAALCAGCSTPLSDKAGAPTAAVDMGPFEVTLLRHASWPQGQVGYDPVLPGYHLAGRAGSIRLRPKQDGIPTTLVLTIQTSDKTSPTLESVTMTTPSHLIETGMRADQEERVTQLASGTPSTNSTVFKAGTHVLLEPAGDAVRVTLRPGATRLMRGESTVSWIDRWK